MRRHDDLDHYLRDSADSFVVDRHFAAFHAGSLFGIISWGRPDAEDAARICRARGAELTDPGPHHVIMDYRQLEGVDPDAFSALATFLNANREVLGRVTRRTALLVPSMAFAGATVAGFYNVVKSPYESKVFTTVEEAETWLEIPTTAPVLAVAEAAAQGRSTSAALAALLETRPALSVDEAAEALGTSARTLQRRLQLEGTTYQIETRKAVIQRAKHLLSTTEQKVADIAAAAGMTPQHFSEVFRADTGLSPAAWRAQVRKP